MISIETKQGVGIFEVGICKAETVVLGFTTELCFNRGLPAVTKQVVMANR